MNSHEWTVSDSLPCATKVAFLDSPKDFTSERIDSFLGKRLRSPRGNFFALFECFFALFAFWVYGICITLNGLCLYSLLMSRVKMLVMNE